MKREHGKNADIKKGPESAVDPRLRQALERGADVGRKLMEAEGGSLPDGDAARRLGIRRKTCGSFTKLDS